MGLAAARAPALQESEAGAATATLAEHFVARWRHDWRWRSFDAGTLGLFGPYRTLGEDEEGRVWVSSLAGLAYYDGFRWHRPPPNPELGTTGPGRFVRAPGGELIVSRVGRLWQLRPGGVEPYVVPGLTDAPVRELFELEGQIVVVQHAADGTAFQVSRYDGNGLTVLPSAYPPDARPLPLYYAAGSRLLASSRHTTKVFEDGRWRTIWNERLHAIAQSKHGHGIARLEPAQGPSHLVVWGPDGRERELGAATPEGHVTFRALGDLLFCLRGPSPPLLWSGEEWITLLPPTASSRDLVDMMTDSRGHLWVASRERILLCLAAPPRWEPWQHVIDSEAKWIHERTANASLLGTRGEIWIAVGGCLERRSAEGVLLAKWERDALFGRHGVSGLAEDREGRVWVVAPVTPAVVLRQQGELFVPCGEEQGLSMQSCRTLACDAAGQLWVGGRPWDGEKVEGPSDVLYRWDGARWHPSGRALGLTGEGPHFQIVTLKRAPDGTLWAGSTAGLHRFRGERWENYSLGGSRSHQAVTELAPLDAGRCWFGNASHGLGHFDEASGPQYLRGELDVPPLRVSSLALDARQRLWIGSGVGLACLDGDRLDFEPLLPHAGTESIRTLLVFGDRLLVGAVGGTSWVLDLSPAHREQYFELSATTLTSEGNNLLVSWELATRFDSPEADELRSRFRIDGGAWSEWSQRRQVAVTGLAPGRHGFELEVLDPISGAPVHLLSETLADVPLPPYLQLPVALPFGLGLAALLAVLAWTLVQRQRLARRTREEMEYSRLLLESSQEGIFAVQPDGRVRAWNTAMERLTGLPRERALGRAVHDILPLAAEIDAALGGRSPFRQNAPPVETQEPLQLRPANGKVYECVLSAVRAGEGPALGTICIVRNVTARAEMEAKLRSSQKLEAVGTLAAGIAHDVNNALQSILGHADLARASGVDAAEREDCLARLVEAAERTRAMTRTLLGFARPGRTETEPIELGLFALEMRQILRPLLPRSYELQVEVEDGLRIRGDVSGLQQVIVNLVVNARDAMPGGGPIQIHVERKDRHAVLRVVDRGSGIAPEIRDRVLEPFFTTKPRGKGTGLGLAVVDWVLREHGGRVEMDSQPGRGTELRCVFPLEDGEIPAPSRQPDAEEPALDGASQLVLLVEDDEQILGIQRALLESHGFEVVACITGTEALERLDALAERLHFAILDYDLPGANGLEVLAHLRARRPELPALLVSGLISEHLGETELERVLQLGKPFRNGQLLAKVAQMQQWLREDATQ